MHASLIVESIEDFQKWVANGARSGCRTQNEDPVAHGKLLTQQRTCVACHSIDGSKLVGPTYKGLYQRKEVVVTNGAEREIIADEEYIVDPSKNQTQTLLRAIRRNAAGWA